MLTNGSSTSSAWERRCISTARLERPLAFSILSWKDRAPLTPEEHERVLDWWASALDRDARPRTEFDRQAVYQRIRDADARRVEHDSRERSRLLLAFARPPRAARAILQGAWDAAQAGWVRAPLSPAAPRRCAPISINSSLPALVPDRARALGQPPETFREEWEALQKPLDPGMNVVNVVNSECQLFASFQFSPTPTSTVSGTQAGRGLHLCRGRLARPPPRDPSALRTATRRAP